jgi:ElaB/YqjD/DUF883 family membrane-anchored ribosome-binding protein
MPPRKSELPEGTDHIINGAMETGSGGTSGGSAGAGGGFVGSGAADDTGGTSGTAGAADDTGGRADDTGGGGETMAKGKAKTDGAGGVVEQLRGQASTLRDQAGGRVRDFAEGGKSRASDALDDLSKVVSDTAESIDQRLGGDYGDYARRASDAVANFAETLRQKDVDELYDTVRSAVRKSPAVAIGVAAVVGFTLVRLVKAGLSDDDESDASSTKGA